MVRSPAYGVPFSKRQKLCAIGPDATGHVLTLTHGVMTMSLILVPGNTLITATPEEGRQLAIKLARLVIKTTQPDDATRGRLRDVYSSDANLLMQAGHTVAVEFATIAAANEYWRHRGEQ